MKKIIFTCLLGTIFEWYDFSLFTLLSPILSVLFFPSENRFTSMLGIFSILAIGFFIRPIGAIYFGNRGDTLGRKSTLILTIKLMTLSTIIIGLLPTYTHIGVLAPALLIILRMFQGLSVSGEYSSVITFLSEFSGSKNKITSMSVSGTAAGMALGSLFCSVLLYFLTQEQMLAWGWRIPFLASIVLGFISIYMRRKLIESPEFALLELNLSDYPIVKSVKNNSMDILKSIGVYCANFVLFYTIFIFMPANLIVINKFPSNRILIINTLALLTIFFLTPIFGHISDKFNKIKVSSVGALVTLLTVYPLFFLFGSDNLEIIFIAQISFAILVSWYAASIPAIIANSFPTHHRCSGVALVVNLSSSIFGGTAPLTATYLFRNFNNYWGICFYIMSAALISWVVLNYAKFENN